MLEEERLVGVPSHQPWRGILAALNADVVIGCNSLMAPACFKAALCCRVHQETKVLQCYNFLCLSQDLIRETVKRLRCVLPWVALTNEKTLTGEAKSRLEWAGTKVFAWSKGAIVVASTSTGQCCKARVRSIQSREK